MDNAIGIFELIGLILLLAMAGTATLLAFLYLYFQPKARR